MARLIQITGHGFQGTRTFTQERGKRVLGRRMKGYGRTAAVLLQARELETGRLVGANGSTKRALSSS